jgi:hypothetical protein
MKFRYIFLTGLLASAATAAEAWPQFRGPTGQGIASGAGPLKWSKDSGIAWKIPLSAQGWSSPVIADGKIILTGSRKDGDITHLTAFALDVATGKTLWNIDLFKPTAEETAALHGKNSLASSTPIIADGIVYVHFGHMGTAALRLADGEVVWKKQVSYKPMHGNGSSPSSRFTGKTAPSPGAHRASKKSAAHFPSAPRSWSRRMAARKSSARPAA